MLSCFCQPFAPFPLLGAIAEKDKSEYSFVGGRFEPDIAARVVGAYSARGRLAEVRGPNPVGPALHFTRRFSAGKFQSSFGNRVFWVRIFPNTARVLKRRRVFRPSVTVANERYFFFFFLSCRQTCALSNIF